MTLQELIIDLKAAGANDNTLHLALNCYELGKADAQRKPLTDKQLNIIGSRWHLNLLGTDEKAELFAFARAIEAAHGIKGPA
jgi:hypothetical protein